MSELILQNAMVSQFVVDDESQQMSIDKNKISLFEDSKWEEHHPLRKLQNATDDKDSLYDP